MKTNDEIFTEIILAIESTAPQNILRNEKNETFQLKQDPHLVSNLSGNIGALFIRSLLHKLNVDEHHALKWKMDNKYWQYRILNYYIPNCVAMTMSISELLNMENGIQKIKELCNHGFFIKATLGDGSGRAKSFDRTNELNDIIKSCKEENEPYEKWILQERMDFISEFRIHTFGRDFLYGLTFNMEGDSSARVEAEEFVRIILKKLPDTILEGTLIGWDIGITSSNKKYVIETNITGFHSEFSPGFQTSGYFGDPYQGPIMCAWINNYFRSKYQISIDSVEKSLLITDQFYKEFLFFASIFKNEHFEIIKNKTKNNTVASILYFGNDVNSSLIFLLGYFIEQNFADVYYMVIDEKYYSTFTALFSKHSLLKVLLENRLFPEDVFTSVKQTIQTKQKEIFSYQAAKFINEKSYFII